MSMTRDTPPEQTKPPCAARQRGNGQRKAELQLHIPPRFWCMQVLCLLKISTFEVPRALCWNLRSHLVCGRPGLPSNCRAPEQATCYLVCNTVAVSSLLQELGCPWAKHDCRVNRQSHQKVLVVQLELGLRAKDGTASPTKRPRRYL